MFRVQWVMPDTIVSLFFAWRNVLGKSSSNVWNMVPACLMWLIWWERNTHIFEDIERLVDLLRSMLAGTLFGWSRTWGFKQCISIFYFLLVLLFDLLQVQWFTIVNTLFLFSSLINFFFSFLFLIRINFYYLSKKKKEKNMSLIL